MTAPRIAILGLHLEANSFAPPTVREDFLLSNSGLDMNTVQGAISPMLAALPPEVIKPLVGVEGAYLDTAFAQLKADYGSVEGYLEKELGVGPAQIALLKRRMLD